MTKIKTVYQLIAEIERLEKIKADLVDQVVHNSRSRRIISEDIRNATVLQLVDELRDISDQIDELKGMTL